MLLFAGVSVVFQRCVFFPRSLVVPVDKDARFQLPVQLVLRQACISSKSVGVNGLIEFLSISIMPIAWSFSNNGTPNQLTVFLKPRALTHPGVFFTSSMIMGFLSRNTLTPGFIESSVIGKQIPSIWA